MKRPFAVVWFAALSMAATGAAAQDRETKVRTDRKQVEAGGFWIYNDPSKGIAEAKRTGKPLLVVFRCIPCEACAQLDEQVVERDPVVRGLLDRFVCVRIVYANGMDLSLFQFDYDQSWAAFLMNADKTIYGRYGTRSHQTESDDDVSLAGFAKALTAALELHEGYPANRERLRGKQGAKADFPAPEKYPSLAGKFGPAPSYEGSVVKSCIHCHQVGEAHRLVYRAAAKPIPDKVLFPYPHPKILGLVMDPKEKAKVAHVAEGSRAAKDGFQPGDEIVDLDRQPILSTADIQWVLHNAGASGTLPATLLRDGKTLKRTLTLAEGWRRRGDLSWRATSWDLRRMATGGLLLEDLAPADRRKAGLSESSLALLVRHVGEYGDHAVALRAGFRKDDLIVSVDGRSQAMTESDLLAYVLNQRKPGDKLAVSVLRDGKRMELTLPTQ